MGKEQNLAEICDESTGNCPIFTTEICIGAELDAYT